MKEQETRRISKFMSLVLRHQPERAGLELDDAGWTCVSDLLAAMQRTKHKIDREQLEKVVAENDKQRFEFSEDGQRIRARQGHSVTVDLGYPEATPPEILHHGTPTQFLDPIRREGLTKQKRHHVHLHQDGELAASVGQRRGKPVVLTIEAARMADAGYKFFVSENDVWLTDHVPPEFIRMPE